jgi:hypothetical protein
MGRNRYNTLVLDTSTHMKSNLMWNYLFTCYILFCKCLETMGSNKICMASCTKCNCPVLNAPRADTPFCLEHLPKGFSQRVDMQDKNGVFVLRASKQGWCMCNFTKSGPSKAYKHKKWSKQSIQGAATICLVQFPIVKGLKM